MRRSFIFSILIVLLPCFIYAQAETVYMTLKQVKINPASTNDLFFFCRKSNEDDLSKKPQLPWQKSIVVTTTQDTFAIEARFNPQQDIEIHLADSPYVLFQEKVQAILIGQKVYIAVDYPENDQLYRGYFELISEGKVSLLLKNSKTYYYKKIDQPAFKLTRSKKVFSNIFNDKKKVLGDFIADNKIHLKKDEDLLKVFNFMNTTAK